MFFVNEQTFLKLLGIMVMFESLSITLMTLIPRGNDGADLVVSITLLVSLLFYDLHLVVCFALALNVSFCLKRFDIMARQV